MNYPISDKYMTPAFMDKIMGPNPLKLAEELLQHCALPANAIVCDLGSGQGVTSVYMAEEHGFRVYACDWWSEPEEHLDFFAGHTVTPVKANVEQSLPFPAEYFDGLVSIDAYHYFGRREGFLEEKILPYVKPGGYIYIAVPGFKKDCHDNLPPDLLLSWTPEDLEAMHDPHWWQTLLGKSSGVDVLSVYEMETMMEAWEDWLALDNPYAIGDRKTMHNGGETYLNFVGMVLQKK